MGTDRELGFRRIDCPNELVSFKFGRIRLRLAGCIWDLLPRPVINLMDPGSVSVPYSS